jgi:hypothetical protein
MQPRRPGGRKVMTTINEDVRQRGRTLTLAWGGEWNEETHKGRKAACPECGVFDVSITPKAGKGVLLICNACSGGARGDNRLVLAAARSGFECGAGNGPKPHRHNALPGQRRGVNRNEARRKARAEILRHPDLDWGMVRAISPGDCRHLPHIRPRRDPRA